MDHLVRDLLIPAFGLIALWALAVIAAQFGLDFDMVR